MVNCSQDVAPWQVLTGWLPDDPDNWTTTSSSDQTGVFEQVDSGGLDTVRPRPGRGSEIRLTAGDFLDTGRGDDNVMYPDLYPGDAGLDSNTVRIVLVILYSVLAAAGFTSNVLVCFVVARQTARKSTAGKMIPRHLYIANLAAADVLLCLLALPGTLWWLTLSWAGSGGPMACTALCRVLPGLQCACSGAAAGTVAAIALDRYRAIVTRAHDASRSRRAVPRVIAAIWGAACLLAVPLVVFHDVEMSPTSSKTVWLLDTGGFPRCVSRWPSPWWKLSYACLRACLHFALPALSLCIVHTRISAYLHSRPMQWRRRRSRRTALVLGTVAAVFTFSWLPITAFQLLVPEPGKHRLLFACCHLLAMSSTLSNPLLYGWLNSHFRREFRSMMRTVLPARCCPLKDKPSCKACRALRERAALKELESALARSAPGTGTGPGPPPTGRAGAGVCRSCCRCVGSNARGRGRTRHRLFQLQVPAGVGAEQPDRRGSLTFLTSLTARHSITLLTHLSGGTTTTTSSRLDIL